MSQPKQVENRIRVSQQFKDHIYAHCGDVQPGEWLEKQVRQAERRDKKIEELEIKIARLESQSPQRTAEGGLTVLESGVPPEEHEPSPSAPDPSTLPFGALQNSQPALTDTSTDMNSGNESGTQLSPRQRQALLFHGQLLMLKIEAARKIEQEKQETARQRHWRPARRPIPHDPHDESGLGLKGICPLGRTSTFCIQNPCDKRGNCEAKPNDCRITPKMRGAEMSYVQ